MEISSTHSVVVTGGMVKENATWRKTGRHTCSGLTHNAENDLTATNDPRKLMGKRQKAVYRLLTAPDGGTRKYTLAFAYHSPR